MGKNRKELRTRGNTRPSNSSHTAVLLSSSSASLGSTQLSSELVPLKQVLDDAANIDADLSLCFKRMIKRDPVTKLKAIQEFSDFCKEKDEESLQAILSIWSRLYNKLCLDSDNKVREATHLAQQNLVIRIGRGLAPHLKAIMGSWLISQCDPHAPAASLAKSAFQAAFLPEKQQEAFQFCKKEIFSFIKTNLLDTSLQGASDLNNPEDNKYFHVVTCSLSGLQLFLSTVSEVSPHQLDPLLADPRFWKLAKNKNSQIRASWYRLVGCISKVLPDLARRYASQICSSTLSYLSNNDFSVAPSIWEAALYTLACFKQECWEHVNLDKTVIPQLLSLLKSGGNGIASIVFPSLLPLLGNLPPRCHQQPFLKTFFDHFHRGLILGQDRPHDSKVMLTSYLECMKWAYSTHDASLLQQQFIPLLSTVLTDPACKLGTTQNFALFHKFLNDVYLDDANLEAFWQNISDICLASFKSDSQNLKERIADFLCCYAKNVATQKNVKFEGVNEDHHHSTHPSNSNLKNSPSHHVILISHKLCKYILEKPSFNILMEHEILNRLIQVHPSLELFTYLHPESPEKFYWENIKPWYDSLADDPTVSTATSLVQLTVTLLSILPEQAHILNILNDITENVNTMILSLLVPALYKLDSLDAWFNEVGIKELLSKLAVPENMDLLLACIHILQREGSQNLLLNPLFMKFWDTLKDTPPDSLTDKLVLWICESANDLYPFCKNDEVEMTPFLMALVKLLSPESAHYLEDETLASIEKCLIQGIEHLSDDAGKTFLNEAAKQLHSHLISPLLRQTSALFHLTSFLLEMVKIDQPFKENLISEILPSQSEWQTIYSADMSKGSSQEWMIKGILSPYEVMNDIQMNSTSYPLDVALFVSSLLTSHSSTIDQTNLAYVFIVYYHYKQLGYLAHMETLEELAAHISKLRQYNPHLLMQALFERSKEDGYFASVCLYHELSSFNGNDLMKFIDHNSLDWTAHFHTVQILVRLGLSSNDEKILSTLSSMVDSIPPDGRDHASLLSCFLSSKAGSLNSEVILLLDFITKLRHESSHLFLSSSNLGEASNELILWNTEMVTLLDHCVQHQSSPLTQDHWETLLCSLADWITAACLLGTEAPIEDGMQSTFSARVFYFLHHVLLHLEEKDLHSPELLTTWKEFFSPIIYENLLKHFLALGEATLDMNENSLPLSYCNHLNLKYVSLAAASLPISALRSELFPQLVALVSSPYRPIKVAGHTLALRLIPSLSDIQRSEEDNSEILPPEMIDLISTKGLALENLASGKPFGEHTALASEKDLEIAMTYLLIWIQALTYIATMSTEVRYQVANSLSEKGHLETLMSVLFHLLPTAGMLRGSKTLFAEKPLLPLQDKAITPTEVNHLTCYVYIMVLSKLPAAVRRWWNHLEKRAKDLVDKYTTTYASGIICSREIGTSTHQFDNMLVKMRPTVREVSATYTLEDVSMELELILPTNHPLGPVSINYKQRIGVKTQQWKLWMLQLNTFLSQQNGSILDGLLMWKRNLDKVFQGVEECTVCFYIFHGSSGQLPRQECRTCHKKFHSACLYKWFSTSNNSTCPHCRESFW